MNRVCVIFDLDGTLVDSEVLCNQAFLDLLPQLNETVGDLVLRYRGKKLTPILADIENRLGWNLPETFEQHYRQRVSELFCSELKPMPGVIEMLEDLRLPKCIASSGPMSKIRQSLEVSGLASYFGDNLFSSYDVGSWKPDPGLFQYAAKAMGFAPDQCVVVEDSDVGIEAAAAASMRAFRYVLNGENVPLGEESIELFDDMLLLPELLVNFAK
jgi:HAD superfamily hydrolase (TIGR01509 family)